MKVKQLGSQASFYLTATLVALPFVLPLAWMIASSLRTPGLPPPRGVEWIPQPLAWSNYSAIFSMVPLARYLFNSVLVSGLAVAITLLVASWAGFGMAQLGPGARRFLLAISVGLLMVPITALWLTRFLLFDALGWIDTYLALLAPALMGSSPLFVLLFYWAFRRLEPETYEAARLEGAGPWTIWRRVGLPQVRPTMAAVASLTFILYWNDFINPLIYLKSQARYTLAVGLQQLQQLDRTNWPLLLAAALVMTLPVVLLFIITQRYYLQDHPPGS
jgi:multiple sugar transport system permease protein